MFRLSANDAISMTVYQGPNNFNVQGESGWSGAMLPVRPSSCVFDWFIFLCLRVSIYLSALVYVSAFVCIYLCMDLCMYVCMYFDVCIYLSLSIYLPIHPFVYKSLMPMASAAPRDGCMRCTEVNRITCWLLMLEPNCGVQCGFELSHVLRHWVE
jgi:hypothetical protein